MKIVIRHHKNFIVILLYLFLFTTIAFSKNYSIEKIIINSEILPDGSLMIEEERHYLFNGKFSWAEYKLPLDNLGKVTDFRLSEHGNNYQQNQKSKKQGNYKIDQDEDEFYVKWYYKAENERRIFKLNYRVEDVVTVYDDVADFHYKFVGEENQKLIGLVDVTLKLLFDADTNRVKAWAHGPLNGNVKFDNGLLQFKIAPLSPKKSWEARVIFPPIWVNKANIYMNVASADKIKQQEEQWAIAANDRRIKAQQKLIYRQENQGKMIIINIFLSVVVVIVFIFLYNRFGKAHHPNFNIKYSSEIPENISPALANYIYNAGNVNAGAMIASLFNLAKWSYIKIEEKQIIKKSTSNNSVKSEYILKLNTDIFEEDIDKLSAYELNLITFLFDNLSENKNELFLKELNKSRTKFQKWFVSWQKLIKKTWGDQPIYDKMSIKNAIISAIISLLLSIVGIVSIVIFGKLGLISLLTGVTLLFISFSIVRFTKKFKWSIVYPCPVSYPLF